MDPKELRKFAAECLDMARKAAPDEATKLRAMARDMLDVAAGGADEQQHPSSVSAIKNGPKLSD
jgi:hypothetical protein